MKQIEKTSTIKAKLQERGLDPEKVAVFEATAVNTRPLRKKHPLYKNGVIKRNVLLEMSEALTKETVPVQILHDTSALPLGRVFDSMVLDYGNESEIRVLMAISTEHPSEIAKLESGVIDQVSVNLLPKKILNSKSGFDYLGASATRDHIWSGTDPDGNTIGENGVFGYLDGLSEWNELSLVHKGGAENARVVSRDKSVFSKEPVQRLAAQGVDPDFLMLNATQENETMANADLQATIDQISDLKVELSNTKREKTEIEAQLEASTREIETLRSQLATASTDKKDNTAELAADAEAKAERITALEAEAGSAKAELKEVARVLLVAKGDVKPVIPDDIPGLVATISGAREGLAAKLVVGGKAEEAAAGDKEKTTSRSTNAFKSNR